MSDPLDLVDIEARMESSDPGTRSLGCQADRRALLAEVKRLRADREKAREAWKRLSETMHHGGCAAVVARVLHRTAPCSCGYDEARATLRAALSEPPAGS